MITARGVARWCDRARGDARWQVQHLDTTGWSVDKTARHVCSWIDAARARPHLWREAR